MSKLKLSSKGYGIVFNYLLKTFATIPFPSRDLIQELQSDNVEEY